MNEFAEQKTLLRWWGMAHKGLGVPDHRLLFAIPNGAYLGGGKLGAMRGGRLRAEGMVAGAPDLFLAVPRERQVEGGLCWPASGLFIEMKKTHGGKWSSEQREMAQILIDQGYAFALCRGWEEGVKEIEKYLSAPR
jgi:hypothetical protein